MTLELHTIGPSLPVSSKQAKMYAEAAVAKTVLG
jgi:hypothetical protein